MPAPQISIEDDPTPLVRSLSVDLGRRLEDPEFAAATASVRGTAAVQVGPGPEAATIELDDSVLISHGVTRAQVTATLDAGYRWNGGAIAGEDEHPELARWLSDLAAPPPRPWREAAALLWAELESAPGAPGALLVVDLDTGESERYGNGSRAYEIRGGEGPLLALLEGRASLIEEASAGRVQIRGSFPEISVISGACMRVRMGVTAGDA